MGSEQKFQKNVRTSSNFLYFTKTFSRRCPIIEKLLGEPATFDKYVYGQFVQLDKIGQINNVICFQMFYNKMKITIRNIKSLNIEPLSYKL